MFLNFCELFCQKLDLLIAEIPDGTFWTTPDGWQHGAYINMNSLAYTSWL